MDFLIDNSKLENLIDFDEAGNLKDEEEFLRVLKTSQLYVPADFSEERYMGFDEESDDVSFDVKCLTADGGLKAVPLFTRLELLEENGIETSTIALPMTSLAVIMLEGEYDVMVINPFTEMSIDIPSETFLEIFRQDYEGMTILDVIRDASFEIDEKIRLYLGGDEDFMMRDAVDGVYVADKPLNVNSSEKDSRYVNVLEMPESSKVLYIGEGFAGADFDMILAPESRFEYVEDISDGVHLWKCVGQPFFE